EVGARCRRGRVRPGWAGAVEGGVITHARTSAHVRFSAINFVLVSGSNGSYTTVCCCVSAMAPGSTAPCVSTLQSTNCWLAAPQTEPRTCAGRAAYPFRGELNNTTSPTGTRVDGGWGSGIATLLFKHRRHAAPARRMRRRRPHRHVVRHHRPPVRRLQRRAERQERLPERGLVVLLGHRLAQRAGITRK